MRDQSGQSLSCVCVWEQLAIIVRKVLPQFIYLAKYHIQSNKNYLDYKFARSGLPFIQSQTQNTIDNRIYLVLLLNKLQS